MPSRYSFSSSSLFREIFLYDCLSRYIEFLHIPFVYPVFYFSLCTHTFTHNLSILLPRSYPSVLYRNFCNVFFLSCVHQKLQQHNLFLLPALTSTLIILLLSKIHGSTFTSVSSLQIETSIQFFHRCPNIIPRPGHLHQPGGSPFSSILFYLRPLINPHLTKNPTIFVFAVNFIVNNLPRQVTPCPPLILYFLHGPSL